VGDPSDVQSYFSYGANVLAAADAEVVAAADGFKDQVTGELPTDITLEELLGNHVVLDLDGSDHFAFYAHLKPNSVAVKEGDRVRRGQVLGLVGNIGNTSAPHLHFHVMASPSSVGSNGLPYVIDTFDLLSRSASDEAFGRAIEEGKPLEVVAVDDPGRHTQQLPLDHTIVGFASSD
jgi:murein DD-endopeptidase MepM/ murein hydrolase activator NlpD